MTALISVIFAELTIIGKLNSKDTLFTRTKSSKSSEINTFKMVQDTKYQTMMIFKTFSLNTKFGIIFWAGHFKWKIKSWIRNLEKSSSSLIWKLIFNFHFFSGIVILILNKNDSVKVWIYRSFFPLVWLFILCAPLYQVHVYGTYFVISISSCQRKKLWDIQWFGI